MRTPRSIPFMLAAAIATAPFAACNNSSPNAPPPAVDDTRGGGVAAHQAPPPVRPHMATRNKVVILAGAAALYYLYKHHKSAEAADGVDGQYYVSKNGRVYYRDVDHRAHWVTPPPGGIAVPEDEAAQYKQFQGYNNNPTGDDLTTLSTTDYTNE